MERDVTVTEKYLLPLFLEEYPILRKLRMCGKVFRVGVGNLHKAETIVIIFKVPLDKSKMSTAVRGAFSKHLEVLRQEDVFERDCIVSFEEGEYTHHAVSLYVPDKFCEKVNNFLKGRYSLMYTDEEASKLSSYFVNYVDVSKVLSKNREYLPTFVAHLNKTFNTTLSVEDYEDLDVELDIPPLVFTDLIELVCQG